MGNLIKAFPDRFRRITNSGAYNPQIDGLRFIAIMQVAIYHAVLRGDRAINSNSTPSEGWISYFPNGAAGVELFFFISGYIIAYPFFRETAFKYRDFYLRRLTRLEPPYFLVLLLLFIGAVLTGYSPSSAHSFNKSDVPLYQSLFASLVYSHGLLIGAPPKLNPPLWSLEIEIQFYLAAPFLILAYKKIKSNNLRILLGILVIIITIASQPALARDHFTRYFVISHAFAFLMGIVASDLSSRNDLFSLMGRYRFDWSTLFGIILLTFSSSLFYVTKDNTMAALILLLRATSIALIYIGVSRGNISRSVFSNPWVTLIGGACYSIYLVHVPVIQLGSSIIFKLIHPTSLIMSWAVSAIFLVPLSVISGLVFYVFIERPCMDRNWPRRVWHFVGR